MQQFSKEPRLLKLIILLSLLLYVQTTQAQRLRKVSATIQVPLEDSHCVGSFKQALSHQAKIQALAQAFGTVVQQGTDLTVANTNSGEEASTDSRFTQLSSSQVKGEWIKTISEEFSWSLQPHGDQVVPYLQCKITGKAREIDATPTDFESLTLSCPSQDVCATTVFEDMQTLYVMFQTPEKGYLSVFMREEEQVYRLFPYAGLKGDQQHAVAVAADLPYILFSPKHGQQMGISARLVDELQLSTAGQTRLFNRIYVVFSPSPYKKPILETGESGIKTISPEAFDKWLAKNRATNKGFQEKITYITITP